MVKITEADVGREFITTNGQCFKIKAFKKDDADMYPVLAARTIDGRCVTLTADGYVWSDCTNDDFNFKQWVNKVNITEADVGRTFVAKNGSKLKIDRFVSSDTTYPVRIKLINESYESNITGSFTQDGRIWMNGTNNFDFDHWQDEIWLTDADVGRQVELRNGDIITLTGTVIGERNGKMVILFKSTEYSWTASEWDQTGQHCELFDDCDYDIVKVLEATETEEAVDVLARDEDSEMRPNTTVPLEEYILSKYNNGIWVQRNLLEDIADKVLGKRIVEESIFKLVDKE